MSLHLQLVWYMSSSPVVAEWDGLPAAALAFASGGEFFTGLYAAQTCTATTHHLLECSRYRKHAATHV